MMKLPPRVYRGIEYVMLSDLPEDQQQLAKETPDLEFIKILLADGRLEEYCIQFQVYSAWYEHVMTTRSGAPDMLSKNPDMRVTSN